MPGIVLPFAPRYVPPPRTNETCGYFRPTVTEEGLTLATLARTIVDYAELAVIDLSKTYTYDGRAELALKLRDAMTDQGFFYVINHGYTQAQVK